MSCGICNPVAFREAGCLYGYITARTPSEAISAARSLFFMGAQYIFCDSPTGRLANRKDWRRLCKLIREGDRVVLPSFKTLGDRPSRQEPYFAQLESLGADVFVITEEGAEMAAMNELFPETDTEDAAA